MKADSDIIAAYARFAVRRKWLVFIAMGVLLVAMAFGLPRYEFRASYRIWFSEDSPTFKQFVDMIHDFGSDGVVLVVLREPDEGVVTNRALGAIERLTAAFWKIEGVKRVDSLSNFATVRAARIEHESGAFAVGPSWVAASGANDDIFIWDTATFAKRRLVGHSGLVEHLVASPDGARLYSAGLDRSVHIWDVASGDLVRVLGGVPNQVSALTLSADGSTIVAGSHRSVVAFDIASGTKLWRKELHDDYVTRLLIVGDRVYAASRSIEVLDLKTGANQARWAGHEGFVTALTSGRGDGRVLSAGEDGRVIEWDAAGASTELCHLEGLAALSLALRGDAIVAGFADGTVREFEGNGAAPIVSHVHDDWVVDLVVDRGIVYAASRDRMVSMHVPGQGPRTVLLEAHRAAVRRVIAGADGRIYSLGDEGDVYVWDPQAQRILARLNRAKTPSVRAAVPISGERFSAIEVANGFRYPVRIRVGGEDRGTVDGGRRLKIDRVPLVDPKPCDDDAACGQGQYCDWEADEPVCAGTIVVEAFAPGSEALVWAGDTAVAEGSTVVVRVPADEPFSVSPVVKAPVDPRATVRGFRHAFGKPVDHALGAILGKAAGDPDTFITPDTANRIADRLSALPSPPEDAVKFLTTLSQAKLSPLNLPQQPFRLREAIHHMMRPPGRPAEGAVLNEARDTTMIAVSVNLDDETKALDRLFVVRDGVQAALDAEIEKTGFEFKLTGDIIQDTNMIEYARRDLERVFPAFMFVIAALLLLTYRRISGVFLPLGLVALSVLLCMGLAAHLGAELNNMTVGVPQIVVAACIGDAVHIFNGYVDRLRQGQSREDATVGTVTANWSPCLWTTASTAIGFYSLSWSDIGPVGTFGWMAGIGVVGAFVISFAIMPGVMALLPVPKRFREGAVAEEKPSGFDEWIDARMGDIARYVNASTGSILFMSIILAAISLYGLRFMSFDSNAIRFFAADSEFRQASRFIEDHISGPVSLQVVVDTGEPGGIRKTKHMEQVAKLRDRMRGHEAITGAVSLSDTMKSMNRVMTRDVDENYRTPRSDADLSSYYNAYTFSLRAGMELTDRVNADESATRITVRLKDRSSGWMLAWGDDLMKWAESSLEGVKVSITGKTWLFSNMLSSISRGFFQNVGSAVLMICLVMFALTRRFGLWFVACVANVLPLAMTMGLLSWGGESLDLSILVSCCVAIGIIVDDSIHFISKYTRLRDKGRNHDDAIEGTILEAGKAMIFTTAVLVSGLAMFTMTDFAVNRNFGVTVAIMLTVGMLFDLTALPAMIRVFHSKRHHAKAENG